MRLFIAIPLSSELISVLTRAQERLLRSIPEGITPTNLAQAHLTLLFIGERPETELPALQEGLNALCAVVSHFTLSLTTLNAFPNRQDPRIVWAGAEDRSGQLARAVAELHTLGVSLGYRPDPPEFVPHLTLARNKQVRNRTALRLFIDREKLPPHQESVDRIVLYESTPTPAGHLYKERYSVQLR